MLQYFVNIWDAVVAFLASNAPMVCLAIVAGVIVGVVVALYIDNLERQKAMLDSEEIGELASAMWEDYQRETALAVDESIVGKDCPLCPEWAEEKYKVEYDDFGEICRIDGVACCDTCSRVHHLTMREEVPDASS